MEGEEGTSCDLFLVYVTGVFVCSYLPWLQKLRWDHLIPPSPYLTTGLNLVGDSRGRCFDVGRVPVLSFPGFGEMGPILPLFGSRSDDSLWSLRLKLIHSKARYCPRPGPLWLRFGCWDKQADCVFVVGCMPR